MTTATAKPAKIPLPSTQDILVKNPPYERMPIAEQDQARILDLVSGVFTVDCFCPKCKQNSTFSSYEKGSKNTTHRGENSQLQMLTSLIGGGNWANDCDFTITMYCSRVSDHKLVVYVAIRDKCLIKVGQYAS